MTLKPLLFRRAWSLSDYLVLRRIRNSGCEFLTNFNGKIGLLRQLRFWSCRRQHEIYLVSHHGQDVGYVSVVYSGGSALITIVMLPDYRAKGLGKVAINYIKQFYNPVVAEIFATNLRSVALFETCGFRRTRDEGDKVFLEFSSSCG